MKRLPSFFQKNSDPQKMEPPNGITYEFADFRLIPGEGLLLQNGEPVPLSLKAFSTLVYLVERHGHLVLKTELLADVWENAFVEEAAVSRCVWTIRSALGEDSKGSKFIQTVPRRGYRFIAPVSVRHDPADIDLRFVSAEINPSTNGDTGTAGRNPEVMVATREPVNISSSPEVGTRIFQLSKSKAVLACGILGATALAGALGFFGYFKSGWAVRQSIDRTFGNGGILGDEAFPLEAVAVQPDGKIVVAGYHGFYPDYNIAVFRYNPDGSRDTTFDGDGRVTTDIGGRDAAHAVALQTDGKILVGANSVVEGSSFVVVRYNSNGSLDTTFDDDGKVITYIGGDDASHSVAVQPDGKILVAGRGKGKNALQDFVLVRYNSNGTLDSSFGAKGVVTTDFNGTDDIANSVALQPDGKIVVSGAGSELFTVVRYNSDGSLDKSFDDDGKVTTGGGVANSVALQPDGKIIAAGNSTNSLVLRRYNSNGSLDGTFADDGTAAINLQSSIGASSVCLRPDGKIVVAGTATWSSTQVDSSLIVARYNSNGFRDKTFGSDGLVVVKGDADQNRYSGLAVAVDVQGRIVIAGGAPSATLFRFLGDR